MSRMNGGIPMGDVPLIGQQSVQFGLVENDGHLASPTVIPALLQGPGGSKVIMTFGGLSKLEHGALLIASGSTATVADAVDKAQAVLAECARRQPQLHQQG